MSIMSVDQTRKLMEHVRNIWSKKVLTENEKDEDALYVEYISDRTGEEPFMMQGKKFQFVQAKYPSGKTDIGVYAFQGDVVYGYLAWRHMYNLKEGTRNKIKVKKHSCKNI